MTSFLLMAKIDLHDLPNPRANQSYPELFVHPWHFKLFIIQSPQIFWVGKRKAPRVLNYYAAFKAQKNQRFLARFRLDYTVYNFIGDKILAPYLSDIKKTNCAFALPNKTTIYKKICSIYQIRT